MRNCTVEFDTTEQLFHDGQMNLHLSNGEAQWQNVPLRQRNGFQRTAEDTNGLVTPGNVVSVAGGALVLSGLCDIAHGDKSFKGVVKIGVGRAADMIDGTIAEKTGTKCPTGEAVDAIVDKVILAAALPIMARKDVMPDKVAGIVFAQNLGNSIFSAVAKNRGERLHPTKEGKFATFGQWAGLGLYNLAHVARARGAEKTAAKLELAAHASTAAAIAIGGVAMAGYARRTLTKPT